MAIMLALPFAGCSSGFNFSSPFGTSASASAGTDDDSKCQSAGFTYGTPEYDQCLKAQVRQRAEPDGSDTPHLYYPPGRH